MLQTVSEPSSATTGSASWTQVRSPSLTHQKTSSTSRMASSMACASGHPSHLTTSSSQRRPTDPTNAYHESDVHNAVTSKIMDHSMIPTRTRYSDDSIHLDEICTIPGLRYDKTIILHSWAWPAWLAGRPGRRGRPRLEGEVRVSCGQDTQATYLLRGDRRRAQSGNTVKQIMSKCSGANWQDIHVR